MGLDVACDPASLVRHVVVPPAVASIVVVAQNERVARDSGVLGVLDAAHAVEVLSDLPLDNLVLLALQILVLEIEVKLVIGLIGADHFRFFHVEADRQNARQGEVRVFDVVAVDFLIDVEEVGVLELLDRLVSDLARPVVHAKASVFQDHFLEVVELVAAVVVGLNVF